MSKLVDYGLCCRIDSDFQYQYAKLWKSIINADEYGIKKYSEKFFNKNISDIQPKSQIVVHRMFASMITGRSWQTISGFDDDRIEGSYIAGSGGAASLSLGRSKGIAQQRTDMEKEAIRRRMMERVYLDAMGTILSVINSEFLLILKTNDLLRSLDEIIGARDTEKSFLDVIILTAEHSSDAIYSEVKKRALFHMKTNILLKGLIDLGLPQTLMLLLSKTYWGALAEWWYMRALVSIPSFILALKGTCS